MKKIIVGLSGLLILVFVVIKVTDAQNITQDVKKAVSEMSKDCAKCPFAKSCDSKSDSKTAETKMCDPAKCKEMGCDPSKCKEVKCNPETCKAKGEGANCKMKNCDTSMCGATKK
jgi:hypothetical protein